MVELMLLPELSFTVAVVRSKVTHGVRLLVIVVLIVVIFPPSLLPQMGIPLLSFLILALLFRLRSIDLYRWLRG